LLQFFPLNPHYPAANSRVVGARIEEQEWGIEIRRGTTRRLIAGFRGRRTLFLDTVIDNP
jgi:hypothetical protein